MDCENCQARVLPNEEHCPLCGAFSGYPNVKIAEDQRPHLFLRAAEARKAAQERGAEAAVQLLENEAARTRAIINMSPGFLHDLLTREHALYASYASLVAAEARRPAELPNDRDRSAVEAKIYGSHANHIVYAALSSDGTGVASYGSVAVQLREIAVAARATVLEENSYAFVQHHQVGVVGPVPPGYLGTWANRAEVLVAKLSARLDQKSVSQEISTLILYSDGDRRTDDFVEVHIWRGFNLGAVEAVRAPSMPSAEDRLLLEVAREKASAHGILWKDS